MKLITRVASVALATVAITSSVQANTQDYDAADKESAPAQVVATGSSGKSAKQPVAAQTPTPAFTGTICTGYDSMYNFRGIDWIPNTGIWSVTGTPVWHITANDTLSMPLWFCVAVAQNNHSESYNSKPYTELDVPINYLHTFGNLGVGCGYELYNYFNYTFPGGTYKPGGTGIQHEINVTANYTVKTGQVAWTPGVTYYYELGQHAPYNYASVNAGSSFLSPALAVAVPVYKDIVTFNPVTQYNISFGYNNTASSGGAAKLYGFNNWQTVAPVTWKITSAISLTGYVAYTYQPNLMNTVSMTASPISKCYAGGSVGYSF